MRARGNTLRVRNDERVRSATRLVAAFERSVRCGHINVIEVRRRRHWRIANATDVVADNLVAGALIRDARLITGASGAIAAGVGHGVVADDVLRGGVGGRRRGWYAIIGVVGVGVEVGEIDADIIANQRVAGDDGVGRNRRAIAGATPE